MLCRQFFFINSSTVIILTTVLKNSIIRPKSQKNLVDILSVRGSFFLKCKE